MEDRTQNISIVAFQCIRNFQDLIKSLQSSPEELRIQISVSALENELSRFKIWCGNLGALQRGRSSLDVRLRDSIIMKATVLRFLEQLQDSTRQSLEITTGLRAPWEDQVRTPLQNDSITTQDELVGVQMLQQSDQESDTSSEDISELTERHSEIQDTLAHLYRLSFRMRNASQRIVSTKPLLMKSIDVDTGVDSFEAFSELDYAHVLESLEELQLGSRILDQDLKPCHGIVSTPGFLINRLSKANTNRRRYFAHWQRHSMKLLHFTDKPILSSTKETTPILMVAPQQSEYDSIPENEFNDRIVSSKSPETLFSAPTNAFSGTDVSGYRLDLDRDLDAESTISYATTARDIRGRSADLPSPPEDALSKLEFVCPYCWVACPSSEGNGKSWRAHILRDLQPYVCTYDNCIDGDKLYDNRATWMEHERLLHRLVFRCFDRDHQDLLWKSKDELRHHFSIEHTDLSPPQVESLVQLSETTTADERDICPLCTSNGPFPAGLQNHIAFHQEQLATFAAPRNVGENEEVCSDNAQGTKSASSMFSSTFSHEETALDGDGLRDFVAHNMAEATYRGSKKKFLPSPALDTATSMETIKNIVLQDKTLNLSTEDAAEFVEIVYTFQRRLFVAAVYARTPLDMLKNLAARGYSDDNIPLTMEAIPENMRRQDFKPFLTNQSYFNAVFFAQWSFQHLGDHTIVPMDSEERSPDILKPKGFGDTCQVSIHWQQHSLVCYSAMLLHS
ncbi:hypothetical protein B0J11DRAFT_158752 [Dendryphion nanum]|uniref:Oxidoreductase acuF-like C2H2 type zinc-finger domain-containing protein n=1 Tax=Dendryphion nanum TaxID=256645 RepID=A0A9P9IYS8_9PLEO|nr:hypothetical protein B0J11DRAFT_158752 [Dendryphion nanum]